VRLTYINKRQLTYLLSIGMVGIGKATAYTRIGSSAVIFSTFVTAVNAREWSTCTSRCSNHTVTCPVLTVTWTVDGFSRSLDSHWMRSGKKSVSKRLIKLFPLLYFCAFELSVNHTYVLNHWKHALVTSVPKFQLNQQTYLNSDRLQLPPFFPGSGGPQGFKMWTHNRWGAEEGDDT